MTTWLTSDQHYYHRNIIDYCKRPFASVEEMNATLTRNHNAVVKPDDIVLIVGDLTLDDRKVKSILDELNGTKYLVAGNHDTCHPANKRYRPRNLERYVDYGFKTAPVLSMRFTDYDFGLGALLITHMPVIGDHGPEDRYSEHRPKVGDLDAPSRIDWLIHGHVHEKWRKRGKMINVGVDAWNYAPVSLEQLAKYLRTAPENDPIPLVT